MSGALARLFELDARGTTIGREVRGGLATFLTMAYILVANPAILSAAGVPAEAAVAATALTAGLASLLMGLGANAPIALASGMGLNAVIAFQAAPAAGSWQAAMGLVVLDGVIVLLFVLLGVREAVVRAIPLDLRRAIGAGIGLFIVFLGLVQARIVVVPSSTVAALAASPGLTMPPVTGGDWSSPEPLIAALGLVIGAVLLAQGRAGAMLLAIAVSALFAFATGHMAWSGAVVAWPRFETILSADLRGALQWKLVPLLFSLVLVDFFDTVGTVTAIGDAAGLTGKDGMMPQLRRVLGIDAVAAIIGGACGASSATSYIESAAGVAEGARTGLHSVVVGGLFLASMVLAPIASAVPAVATAPALILTGLLMCREIGRIDVAALDTAIPALLTIVMVPLTYSISHGIGAGFVAFVAIKLLSGRWRDVHPLMAASALTFAIFFAIG
jgi:AGZA family xanthine/uracil permease-like MFS transporter